MVTTQAFKTVQEGLLQASGSTTESPVETYLNVHESLAGSANYDPVDETLDYLTKSSVRTAHSKEALNPSAIEESQTQAAVSTTELPDDMYLTCNSHISNENAISDPFDEPVDYLSPQIHPQSRKQGVSSISSSDLANIPTATLETEIKLRNMLKSSALVNSLNMY